LNAPPLSLLRFTVSRYSDCWAMSIYAISPLTLGGVKTYPLASRKSKVSVREFARPPAARASLTNFLDSLPNILAANDLRHLLASIHRARKQRAPILWGIGGHVIKVGLGPVLLDLMKRGFVSAIAMNGAALIHDFEIALAGNTSEDVEAGLGAGQFGMASETGEYINEFSKLAARLHIGYGEAAGQFRTMEKHRERPLNGAAALGDGVHDGVVLRRNLFFAGDRLQPCHLHFLYFGDRGPARIRSK